MIMKKLVTISLFVFWAVVTALLVAGLVFYQQRSSNGPGSQAPGGNSALGTTNSTTGGASVVLSAAEVARHNTANDCWMIINGKVYNLTSYIKLHPGGVAMIDQSCGRDGTALYQTKGGGGGNHSSYAYNLLANYLVGSLGESKTASQIQQAQQQSASTSQNLPAGGGGEYEFEDD